MVLALFAIILTLVLVIGIHEAGHALAAYYFGVKIKKVSLGFGKPLLSWQTRSGCQWVWAFWPLGGYVQLENTRISKESSLDETQYFDKKPVWQRLIILLAGAFANVITAWCAFMLVYLLGLNYTPPIVKTVAANSIAAKAGIAAGDEIIGLNHHATPSWSEVGMQLVRSWGQENIPIMVARDSASTQALSINLKNVPLNGVKGNLLTTLGIEAQQQAPKKNLRAHSLSEAWHMTHHSFKEFMIFFFMIFKQLLSGTIPFSLLLGPLGVFAASVASFTQGFSVFMYFIATLSLAVAVVNLLPLPGLDGGSIIYAVIEKVRKRPVSVALEVLLHRLAFIILCLVMVHLLMNDLQRYFGSS